MKDTAAIKEANRLLALGTDADLNALRESKDAVDAEERALRFSEPPATSSATSVAELEQMEAEAESRKKLIGILQALRGRVKRALEDAEVHNAIERADGEREVLESSLAQLDAAQAEARTARSRAMGVLAQIKADKYAAGTRGRGVVGAPAELLDQAFALGAYECNGGDVDEFGNPPADGGTAGRRLRNDTQLEP